MSISTLNEDLNIIQNLVIPTFDDDVDVIQKLDDEPNDVGGLTAAELKAKFDEAGNRIKKYLNETLVPSISETVAEAEQRAEAEAARVQAEEQRITAEQDRAAAETERKQAESERKTAEADRAAAESKRAEAEAARVLAEQQRVDTDSGIVAQATSAAKTAVDAANTASSASIHQPIVGENGNWWTWDIETVAYADTGIYAGGDVPYIGENGNWYVGHIDTGVAATSSGVYVGSGDMPDGYNMQIDPDGEETDFIPHIGANGNWFVGDTDLGVSAAGPEGPEGKAGADGKDGVSPAVSVSTITGGHRVNIQDAAGMNVFDVMDGSGSGLPFSVEILETICENVELTSTNNTYTLPAEITLDGEGLYYIDYKTYQSGELVDDNSGSYFARVTTGASGNYIRWLHNSVTLTSTQITDTWMYDSSILSIYKVKLNVSDEMLDAARKLEGYKTTASGNASHAEGYNTTASGYASHAEGWGTTASGYDSHAEGWGTKASGDDQHAQGKFNIEDTEDKYAHIVGNGASDSERSNAHTLDWNGNAWFAGTVEGAGTVLRSTTEGSEKKFTATVDDTGEVSLVDEAGNKVSKASGDTWDVHYKTNIAEALESGFEITEVDGVPLQLKEMYAMVKVQNGSSSNAWTGCTITTDTGVNIFGTASAAGGVNLSADGYAYFVYHVKILPGSDRYVGQCTSSSSTAFVNNNPWLNNWLDYNKVNYFTGIKCTNNLGAGTSQGYGTEIEIWGKTK